MPRLYVSSRGHTGVSFGCLGFIFVMFAYFILGVVYVALILVALVPFVLVGVAGGACRLGDFTLRAIPAYGQRRGRLGPIVWDTRTLASLTALLNKNVRRRSTQKTP